MPWNKRRKHEYYYYNIWRDGRAVTQYLGRGERARDQAERDRRRRHDRTAAAEAWARELADLEALDAALERSHEIAVVMSRLALIVAGYHRHKKGEWRKRRTHPGRKNTRATSQTRPARRDKPAQQTL